MQDDIYKTIKGMETRLIEIYNETELIDDLKNNRLTQKSHYNAAYTVAMKYFETSEYVNAIYIYTPSHRIVSTYRRAITPSFYYPADLFSDEEKYNAKVIKEYMSSDNTTMLISSYFNESQGKSVLRYVLKLYAYSDINHIIGYIVCDVDIRVLQTILRKYVEGEENTIWLQPAGDRPVYVLDTMKEDEQTAGMVQETIQKGESGMDVGSHILFRVSQEKYNLEAFALMPPSVLLQGQESITHSLIIIAVAMLAAFSLLAVVLLSSVTRPLARLTQTINRIKGGETDLRVSYLKNDEIGQMGQSINDLLDQIEGLIAQRYNAQLLLNQAEYKALQAQINPHFLYNTLDTMSSISESQNNTVVSMLSQSLSNIFRYSLDMKHLLSTVAKEIAHLKNYLYVMNVRMQEEVEYSMHIDEAVLSDLIPRISIQPIVENAINHGIRNVRGKKQISISACAVPEKSGEDRLVITVTDNGCGMRAEEVEVLNRGFSRNDRDMVEQGNSIGLSNINARVKKLFGDAYGLHLSSKIDIGTCVTLTLPRRREGDSDEWQKI